MSNGAADSARHGFIDRLRKHLPKLIIVLLFAALMYRFTEEAKKYVASKKQSEPQHKEQAVNSESPPGRLDPVPREVGTDELAGGKSIPADALGRGPVAMPANEADAELARNRIRIIEAYDLGQRIGSTLSDIESELSSWTAAVNLLNDSQSDLGRRAATRSELVQQYSAVVTAQTTTAADLQTWSRQLDAIHSRVAPAYKENRHVALSQEDLDLLTQLHEKVKAVRDQLQQHRRILDIIEETAKRLDPGQFTLKQALENLQASRDEALRIKLAEAEQAALREVEERYAAQLAEERRKQQELLKQQELEAERAATGEREKELAEIRRRRKEFEDRIAAEKLESEYRKDLPNIKSLLAPFLANAITQPAAGNPISKGGPMKPTSLGALRGSGALEDSNEGLDFLFRVGGHPANERTKGSFPTFVSQRPLAAGAERDQVRKAQQLLIKYGELMVRDGLLSK